jgi:signal transduction histidine kinase
MLPGNRAAVHSDDLRDSPRGFPYIAGGAVAATVLDRMESRTRWSALLVGAAYVGVGVVAWLYVEPAPDGGASSQLILLGLWAAVAVLAIGFARPDFFGLTSRDIGPWLALALAGPPAMLALRDGGSPSTQLLAVLWPLSALPLGIALGGSTSRQAGTWSVAHALTGLAIAVGLVASVREPSLAIATGLIAAITSITLVPALIAAGRRPLPDATNAWHVLVGLAPLVGSVLLADPSAALVVLVVALSAIALVSRATLRPLARTASQAVTQRDLAVAAVEGERRRLAAEIHDGPLQSLLLLGQQLEGQGHADAAATARAIAVELRDVAGELRLPLLDDLGVGPALDWLAERARRLSGVTVTVDYQGLHRPPPEVELAAFRIAQEAVANAIRHGEPPISITYRATGERVSLSVDDAGRGFRTDTARGSHSHGLVNMAQRAEQIGARLEFLRRPDRGMHVGVEWPATG